MVIGTARTRSRRAGNTPHEAYERTDPRRQQCRETGRQRAKPRRTRACRLSPWHHRPRGRSIRRSAHAASGPAHRQRKRSPHQPVPTGWCGFVDVLESCRSYVTDASRSASVAYAGSASRSAFGRVQLRGDVRSHEVGAGPPGRRHLHDGSVVEPQSQLEWRRPEPAKARRGVLEVLGEAAREEQYPAQCDAPVDHQDVMHPHGVRSSPRPPLRQRVEAPRRTSQPAPEHSRRTHNATPLDQHSDSQTYRDRGTAQYPQHHTGTSPCARPSHRSESETGGTGTTSPEDESPPAGG